MEHNEALTNLGIIPDLATTLRTDPRWADIPVETDFLGLSLHLGPMEGAQVIITIEPDVPYSYLRALAVALLTEIRDKEEVNAV